MYFHQANANLCRIAMQVLPGSDCLFEHDSSIAAANPKQLNSINLLGGFNRYCELLEEK